MIAWKEKGTQKYELDYGGKPVSAKGMLGQAEGNQSARVSICWLCWDRDRVLNS